MCLCTSYVDVWLCTWTKFIFSIISNHLLPSRMLSVNIREGFFNYRGYSQTGSISILAAQQKQFRATQRFGDDFPVNHSKNDQRFGVTWWSRNDRLRPSNAVPYHVIFRPVALTNVIRIVSFIHVHPMDDGKEKEPEREERFQTRSFPFVT